MFKFAALYILGCPKIFSQMKWDLNERRRVTKKLILKFRSHAILKNIFHIIKKCFFISPRNLYLLFIMNFHVFLRTSKAERFQFKDSKINWNILSLSNVVYVDKKKKKETNAIEIVEIIFYSSLLILESIFSHTWLHIFRCYVWNINR